MCELFGLSSNQPVTPGELLCRFGARGGDAADNPDGWGLATLEAGAFHLAKEPIAAASSARFRQLGGRTRSSLILGHVRKANPPTAKILENTHPFRRVCCGREWVFAHNGIIPDTTALGGPGGASLCALLGDTDSEHAFCVVLDYIAAAFSSSGVAQGRGWLDALARAAEMLASHGRFNFLLSDGEHHIAYGHDRLHSLADARAIFRLDTAAEMAVIATEPLTEDPGWRAFESGELRVYHAGRQIAQFITHPHAMAPDGYLPRTKPIVSDSGRATPPKNGVSP
jgi:predicted glutamine amidotransferase